MSSPVDYPQGHPNQCGIWRQSRAVEKGYFPVTLQNGVGTIRSNPAVPESEINHRDEIPADDSGGEVATHWLTNTT